MKLFKPYLGMKPSSLVPVVLGVCLLAAASAVPGQQAARGAASHAGSGLCVLRPNDFAEAGVAKASEPSVNVQDGGKSAFCVYAGKSVATGGIELDVFLPAGASPVEIKETYQTVIAESGAEMTPIRIEGADEARWSAHAVSGGPPFATIVVRRRELVFTIGIPPSKNAQAQLTSLSGLVLKQL